MRTRRSGPLQRILGSAGDGLSDAAWARNADVARIGQVGERRTGEVPDALAARPHGPTVLHDLAMPQLGWGVGGARSKFGPALGSIGEFAAAEMSTGLAWAGR